MIYHQAKDPTAYQTIFYRQIGLKKQEEETGNSWRDDEGGYIYTFGTMDTIQMGIGEYTVQWISFRSFNTIRNIFMQGSSMKGLPIHWWITI